MPGLAFIDLSVAPSSEDELLGIAAAARAFGYIGIGIDLELYERVKDKVAELGLRAYPRTTIEAKGKDELFKALSGSPPNVIVAIAVRHLEAYRYAARSRRVDLIRIDPGSGLLPDKSTLNLFRVRGGGAVEVPLRPLLEGSWSVRELREVLLRALRRELRLVVVSDARKTKELWHPLHVVGIMRALGLPSELAHLALTSAPGFVISRRGLSPP
ncbi:MAG: RNase P subunit p30 family protein [Acidilobus sp.]